MADNQTHSKQTSVTAQANPEFDFDQWVKAVKPQLISALQGNFNRSQVAQSSSHVQTYRTFERS